MPDKDSNDPKNLIHESYRIEGISVSECRSIFVDWALSVDGTDHRPMIEALLERHKGEPEGHPMTAVLTEGLMESPKVRRRGGRAARVPND